MFKLESYVTPYILAYLGKYFKNFNPTVDFQMSLFGGGAVFQNLNLDLNVLNEELNLPVTFVSGHIHDLKICVPWTAITSEPIQVSINTIEVILKLKSLDDNSDNEIPLREHTLSTTSTDSKTSKDAGGQTGTPPAGYMQNLISKILMNVHVHFENVIVKYVEDDIVLSLNIKDAKYQTTDSDWKKSFVDLIAPDFILRKTFLFQDLTICLDQRNTAGRIETYQAPFLYRCAFQVRIFQQFKNYSSKSAHFTRMDFHFDEMQFSITDEQVPMVMRLYQLGRSLFKISLQDVSLRNSKTKMSYISGAGSSSGNVQPIQEFEGDSDDDRNEGGGLIGWGAWAVSWLPPLSAIVGDEIENDEEYPSELISDDVAPEELISHYGFYINNVTIDFKALERSNEFPKFRRNIKVNFLPFLKIRLQGVVTDFVYKGDEANHNFGISYISVEPVGFCPCGIIDGVVEAERLSEPDMGEDVEIPSPRTLSASISKHQLPSAADSKQLNPILHYLVIGKVKNDYNRHSIFSPNTSEFRPIFNYDFKYENHLEDFTEEAMLERTPAIAMEYLQTHLYDERSSAATNRTDNNDTTILIDPDTIDLSKDKCLIRTVIAPFQLSFTSGLMHRITLINYAADSYDYEPYGEINKLMGRAKPRSLPASVDAGQLCNFERAYDIYQLTIIQPSVEIWAADHPEYDFESRDKHLNQKRRIKTTTPFSQVVPNWPKLRLTAKCIDGRMLDPNMKFKAFVQKVISHSNVDLSRLPKHILTPFKCSYEIKAYGFETQIVSDKYCSNVVLPCNLTFVQKYLSRPDIYLEEADTVSEKLICTDSIVFQASFVELTISHLILVSMIQHVERFSEHLVTTTLLQDLPADKRSKLTWNLLDLSFRQLYTKNNISTRLSLRKSGIHLLGGRIRDNLPIFYGPKLTEHKDSWFLLLIAQFPINANGAPEAKLVERNQIPSNGLTPTLVVKLSPYKIVYSKKLLYWLNYCPKPMKCPIPQSIRMGREIKAPLRPLSRSSSRERRSVVGRNPSDSGCGGGGPASTSKSVPLLETDEDSSSSIDMRGSSFQRSSSATVGIESNSSRYADSTKSSLPAYQFHLKRSNSMDEAKTTAEENKGWEYYLVNYLDVMKKAIVSITIGHGELWLPQINRRFKDVNSDVVSFDDTVLVVFPKIVRQVPGLNKTDDELRHLDLPIKLDFDAGGSGGKELFPLTLALESMYFATIVDGPKGDSVESPCSEELSILFTISVSTKSAVDKPTMTTACVHTDIASIKVALSYTQIIILTKLSEQMLRSASSLRTYVGLLHPPPLDPSQCLLETKEEEYLAFPSTTASGVESKCEICSVHSSGGGGKNPQEKGGSTDSQHHHRSTISIYEDSSTSERYLPTTDESFQEDQSPDSKHVKATLWLQMTVGSFSFAICGSEKTQDGVPLHKLVLEIEDIVSSLDIQSLFIKIVHKVANIRIRNLEWNPQSSEWKVDGSVPVLLSSSDDITRDIVSHQGTFNRKGVGTDGRGVGFRSRISLPVLPIVQTQKNDGGSGVTGGSTTGSSPQHQKMRGSITVTFTKVKSSNYHKRLGVPSPYTKWNASVLKFAEKDYEAYSPLEGEDDKRYLSEIDIKFKSMDFIFSPHALKPHIKTLNRLLSVVEVSSIATDAAPGCLIPPLNNNTLPLLYMETENIRAFFKGETKDQRGRFKNRVPDFILVEFSSIVVVPHNENPLNRTIVKPLPFHIAEKARVTNIPGSPVEDRQYQIEFQGFQIHTGFWKDIKQKMKDLAIRSSVVLKTQGENPALEWNIRTVDLVSDEVFTFPLLQRMNFSMGLAPAIVYERVLGDPCKSHLIGGHAIELNLVSDVKITLNVDQLDSLKQFSSQCVPLIELLQTKPIDHRDRRFSDLSDEFSLPLTSLKDSMKDDFLNGKDSPASSSSKSKESKCDDSGFDSMAQFPATNHNMKRYLSGLKKCGKHPDEWHSHHTDMVPLDLLTACGVINITMYDLKYNLVQDVEKVLPLACVTIMQPHVMLSLSQHFQKIELSVFELGILLGHGAIDTPWIPSHEDFGLKLFDSIPGERDPKTGMVPPLLNLKIIDFITRPSSIICEIKRPMKIDLTEEKLHIIENLLDLISEGGGRLERKPGKIRIRTSADVTDEYVARQQVLKESFGKIATANITFGQLMINFIVEPTELSLSVRSLIIRSYIKNHHRKTSEAEHISTAFHVADMALSSRLYQRSSRLVTPFNINCDMNTKWHHYLDYPTITITVNITPIAMYIGPQNLLSLIHVFHVFQQFLRDRTLINEEIIDLMENIEPTSALKIICDSYEDDLRAGSFKFCRAPTAFDLPQVYQIAFCEPHRTMTWRYPQQRVLTLIDASPVPIDSDRHPLKKTTLECEVEYWDDAIGEFMHYGTFTLSENCGASVGIPAKDRLHSFNSSIWRIKIITPLEDADSKHLVRPEILAACLKIDSIHDSSLVPKLKAYIEIPRLVVHFVNNFYYAGQGTSKATPRYNNGNMKYFDQPFAKCTLEMATTLLSVWNKTCTVDFGTYMDLAVVESEFLSSVQILEPALFKMSLCLYEMDSSRELNSEMELYWRQLCVKFGATSVNTVLSSLASWIQVMGAKNGDIIDFSHSQDLERVNVNTLLVLNTLGSNIKLHQAGADGSVSIPGGECQPFFWSSQKRKPILKVGVKEKDWCFSCGFELQKEGYIVRNVHRRTVFVCVTFTSPLQRLITFSGGLFVGNALSSDIEVAVLPVNKTSEITWKVGTRDFGSSQLMTLEEIEHIRFRYSKSGLPQPWSSVISTDDFKLNASKNGSLCLTLFEEKNGSLEMSCIWCTLIHDQIEGTTRTLIVLSPCFRVQSFLPSSTLVHVSTAKQSTKQDYHLKGMGEELEIAFTSSHTTTHHLTLQSNPLGSLSTPSIPLLPEGPVLNISAISRPIDDILSEISSLPFGACAIKPENENNHWPFISDVIHNTEWKVCEQPKTDLDVEFTPWIEGLPTVLLQFRPWALFVNLSGIELIFSQKVDEHCDIWTDNKVPCNAVLAPSRMTIGVGRIKIGLNINGELLESSSLRFTEEKRRTDVHHINTDFMIPIDCFSRLDLIGSTNQMSYLTIETRLVQKILIITIRPTFSIVNKTSETIFIEPLAMTSRSAQTQGNWGDEKFVNCITLDSMEDSSHSADGDDYAVPLHRFFSNASEYSTSMKSVKYLAVSCGGPWWFCKLIDFSVIFDNTNATQGVPAAALSVNIPKYGADHVGSVMSFMEDSQLEAVTLPVVISWTYKNGQIWICISEDECPQLILHNTTSVPFLYVQGQLTGREPVPLKETDGFEQYLVIPPQCKAHYSFLQKYNGFLQLTPEMELPSLLLTKLPDGLKDILGTSTSSVPSSTECLDSSESLESYITSATITNTTPKTFLNDDIRPKSTLLIPDIRLKWSKLLNLNGDAFQYFSVGEYVDAKIIIEKMGFTYYIYIENMSNVEVAAKDVRKRISNQGVGGPLATSPPPPTETPSKSAIASSITNSELNAPISQSGDLPFCKSENSSKPRRALRCFIPEMSFIITEDISSAVERRQLISFSMEDIFFEQLPLCERQEFRTLSIFPGLNKTKMRDSWKMEIRIGDLQIDSPSFPTERTCDFPVILKQESDYTRHISPERFGRPEMFKFYEKLKASDSMLSATITYGQSSTQYHSIETVAIQVKSFFLNVEDRLLDFVLPSIMIVGEIVDDHMNLMRRCWPKLIKAGVPTNEEAIEDTINRMKLTDAMVEFEDFFSNRRFLLEDEADSEFLIEKNSPKKSVSTVHIPKKRPFRSKSAGPLMQHRSKSKSKSRRADKSENTVMASSVGVFLENEEKESGASTNKTANIKIPLEVVLLLLNFSRPVLLQSFTIQQLELCLTLRLAKLVYLAMDHSRLKIPEFNIHSGVTTSYYFGQTLSSHYTTGAIFQIGNPMRLIGSLELLGSPGSLVESVGSGLKDFVVYPYQGIFQGPTGFVAGLGNGVTSLVKSITSGALTSVTNWAWSVSRNIDKLTLDEEEQILTEAARRVQLEGFTDGFLQGLTGFGIRLLGAIGGIAHHPINNVIQNGASPVSVLQGVSRGVVGVITRPIGGLVELVAMTGQGVLRSAGWTPQFKTKGEAVVDELFLSLNSIMKYQVVIKGKSSASTAINGNSSNAGASFEEILVLVLDCMQAQPNGHLKPISLILTTQNVYIMDVQEDIVISHFPIRLLTVNDTDDRNLITLKTAPPSRRKDDNTFAQERLIDFVRGTSSQLPTVHKIPLKSPHVLTSVTSEEEATGSNYRSAPSSPLPVTTAQRLITTAADLYSSNTTTTNPRTPDSFAASMYTAMSDSAMSVESNSSALPNVPIWIASSTAAITNGGGGGAKNSEEKVVGEYVVSPQDKIQFENLLNWLKTNDEEHFFIAQS